MKYVILGALLLTCLACATSAPDPPPTLTYTQESITTTPAPIARPTVFQRNASLYAPPATYYPAPTATPAFTTLDIKKCRKFQLEMESEWFRKAKTDAEAVQLINYCNQYLEQTIFGLIPTLAPTIWPTPTVRASTTPTLIPWPTDTPVPLTRQEVGATLDAHRAEVGLDTPKPVPPTATPFPVSDGVSAIPLIEQAWDYLDKGVDTDGIYLNPTHKQSIQRGIADYYALDFERPQRAMSVHVSPPQRMVQRAMTRMSCRECRSAFPCLGSSKGSNSSIVIPIPTASTQLGAKPLRLSQRMLL